ncbi:hypothetical protein VTP01DRAFT_5832 [Rhizomucor pusillus]|uniref:uncharacterized protein n=1 Tax=Rhizomucor pusillus TaxID=4840 RepID=UPI00374339AC
MAHMTLQEIIAAFRAKPIREIKNEIQTDPKLIDEIARAFSRAGFFITQERQNECRLGVWTGRDPQTGNDNYEQSDVILETHNARYDSLAADPCASSSATASSSPSVARPASPSISVASSAAPSVPAAASASSSTSVASPGRSSGSSASSGPSSASAAASGPSAASVVLSAAVPAPPTPPSERLVPVRRAASEEPQDVVLKKRQVLYPVVSTDLLCG